MVTYILPSKRLYLPSYEVKRFFVFISELRVKLVVAVLVSELVR